MSYNMNTVIKLAVRPNLKKGLVSSRLKSTPIAKSQPLAIDEIAPISA